MYVRIKMTIPVIFSKVEKYREHYIKYLRKFMSYDTIQNLRLRIRITSLENDQYFESLFRKSFAPNGSGMCTPGFFTHRIPIQRLRVQIRRQKASTHQPKRNPTNWRHTRLPERKMIIVKITYREANDRKWVTGSEVKWQLTWVTHVMPKRKRATQTPNTTNSRRSFFGNFSIIAEAITSTCPN